jgi:hypothetical protein
VPAQGAAADPFEIKVQCCNEHGFRQQIAAQTKKLNMGHAGDIKNFSAVRTRDQFRISPLFVQEINSKTQIKNGGEGS